MIRVLLVGPFPVDPARVRGGIEAVMRGLVSGLATLEDVEPRVVTFVPGLEAAVCEAVDGVPIVYVPGVRRLGNVTLHIHERRRLGKLLEAFQPDVVHAQDALRYGYVSLKVSRHAPVVVSVHGIVRAKAQRMGPRYAGIRTRMAGVALERYCIRNSRFLVSPTRYAEQFFGDEIRGRIWDVPNPIDNRFFEIAASPESGRILFAGSIVPLKRLPDLINALPTVLESVPGAQLRVAGGGSDPAYTEAIHRRVRRLGLRDVVTFLGGVSLPELVEEYERASVLALPSAQETSPMVIAEAMAAGVPVVATRVGGVTSLVDDGVTGHIVEAGDVAALAATLARMLDDPAAGRALGAAGRARAEERFRACAVATRHKEMYEEIREVSTPRRASA